MASTFMPKSMDDWMRRVESRVSRLERRRPLGAGTAQAGSLAAKRQGASSVTVPAGSIVAFDAGPFEYNYGLSAGSGLGTIEVPASGIYHVAAGVRWNSNMVGITQLRISVNGNDDLIDTRSVSETGGGSQHATTSAGVFDVAAGSEFGLSLYQNTGADQDTNPGVGMPFLAVTLMRAT